MYISHCIMKCMVDINAFLPMVLCISTRVLTMTFPNLNCESHISVLCFCKKHSACLFISLRLCLSESCSKAGHCLSWMYRLCSVNALLYKRFCVLLSQCCITFSGKVKRFVGQFTPYNWTSFEWGYTTSFQNFLLICFLVFLVSNIL